MSLTNTASVLCLFAALLPAPVRTQQVPVTRLSRADRVTTRGFTNLVGVQELRDGRVILVDELERLILILDQDLARGKPIGRSGSGPGEYVVPSRLFSFAGDSSAVLDNPNHRLLVLTPNGDPGGVINLVPGMGDPTATDGQGRIYSSWRGAIRRWSPSSSVLDTVAFLPPSTGHGPDGGRGGMTFQRLEDIVPFSAGSEWAVATDGRIAIVHPHPYRVEMISANGILREGPVIPIDAVRVTEEMKERWRKDRRRLRTIVVGVIGENPPPPRYETRSLPSYEPERWPRFLPPFLQGAVRFAPDGRLWVQRTTSVGEPPMFDVFDRDGRRIEQITLPLGRRLIGFGRGSAYAVGLDELDLEYLERYALEGGGQE